MFISCAVCWRERKKKLSLEYFSVCFFCVFVLFFSCEVVSASDQSVMDPGEQERRWREGGREEKGRVLGQADRDVSTASVIL